MKAKIELKNYKKHKDFTIEFIGGNVYYIQGSNETGKTTFLQALLTLAKGEKIGSRLVTSGETEGSLRGEFTIEGADKGNYIVKYDFDSEDKGNFVIIDPEAKLTKSTLRNNIIAEIFKYNAFTVDEWFAWGQTSEGRKKQANIILNLLPPKAKEEYLDIEAKTNEKTGILYLQRKNANTDFTTSQKLIEGSKLTEEEKAQLSKKEIAENILKELKNFKDYKESLEAFSEVVSNVTSEKDAKVQEIDEEIKALEESIRRKQEQKKTIIEGHEKRLKEATEKKEEIQKSFDVLIKNPALKLSDKTTVEETDKRIKGGENFLEKLKDIQAKDNLYRINIEKIQPLREKSESLDKEIKTLRERKKTILTENKLPVKEVIIEDGEAFYIDDDNVKYPFTETSVSYSRGGLITTKLMVAINKTLPIWLVGKASEYDQEKIETFSKLAKENKGIIIMDRVLQEKEQPLTIECYVNKEK